MADNVGDLVARLRMDTTDFESGARRASSSLDGTVSKMEQTAGRLTSIGKTMSLAVTLPLVGAGIAAFRELEEAGKVAAQTEAAIRSTGGAANVTARQIDQLGTSLMRKSGIDDEAIKSGANLLLTFTQVRNEAGKGNDIFNQATKATLDLSVAFGKDMQSSAIMVGKALNDPIAGVTALRRVGVQLSEQQQESIKAFVAQGDVMSAQKVILSELRTQVGGSAAAYGQTLAGQVNRAKESLLNAGAAMLGSVAPAIEKVSGFVLGAARAFESLPMPVKTATVALAGLAAAAGPVMFVAGKLISAFGAMRSGLEMLRYQATLASMAGVNPLVAGLGMLASVAVPTAIAATALLAGAFVSAHGTSSRLEESAKRWAAAQVQAARSSGDLKGQLTTLQGTMDVLRAKYDELNETRAQGLNPQQAAQYGDEHQKLGALNQALEVNKHRQEALRGPIDELKEKIREAADAERARKVELDKVAQGTLDVADATDEARTAIKALQDTYLAAQGGLIGYQQAQLNVQTAEARLAELQASGTASAEELQRATLDLESAKLQATQAALDLALSEQALADKLRNEGVGGLLAMRNRLQATIDKHGDATGEVQAQINKINDLIFTTLQVPERKHTEFTTNAEWTAQQVQNLKNTIDRIGGFNGFSFQFEQRASGGPVRAGQPYIVGEHRPELFVPDSNGTILPSVPGGGGPQTLVIPIEVGGRAIAEVVVSELNRAGGPKISQKAIS